MRGLAEVDRRYRKLSAEFSLIDEQELSMRLESQYARYLCVQVSGFAEQSVKALVSEYARIQSSGHIHRYVEGQLNLVWGMNVDKFQKIVQALNPTWWEAISNDHNQELDSLASVVSTRNQIAHGGDPGITFATISNYFQDVNNLMHYFSSLLGNP
jgi:hypothetical protein